MARFFPPASLFYLKPLIRWVDDKRGGSRGRGAHGRVYEVIRHARSQVSPAHPARGPDFYEERRRGYGVGCGGSCPYPTMQAAKERAEEREEQRLKYGRYG